jgi:hypothetical protein
MLAHNTATQDLAFVGFVILLGVLAAFLIIRTLRRQSYKSWSWPARYLWYGLVGTLAGLGAVMLMANYIEKMGTATAIWFVASCFLAGFVPRLIELLRPPGSSTPAPR